MPEAPASDHRLEAEISNVVQKGRRAGAEAAFRATVEGRLSSLESQLEEVKSRLNGLLFCIAGTVLTQVLLKVLV